jgi:hypothetical protein
MSQNKINLSIKRYEWNEIANDLIFEDELIDIINQISPNHTFSIFKVNYPYGVKIFERGTFYLPDKENKVYPITDKRIPDSIRESLNYNALPLGYLTGSGGVEVYSELDDRVFSLAYFERGLNLGIWEFFAPPTPFSVESGARSLQMLPKITEMGGYKRLRQNFGVTSAIPKKQFDQWYLFKEIANHKNFSQTWNCDILFFSSEWIKKIRTDPKWMPLYNFLFKRVWQHTEYSRNKMMLDTVWESFSRILTKNRIKPNSYIVDTLKHLTFVAMGAIPAFTTATNNLAAPVDGLLKVYLDDYVLKTYAPSMMQPHHFSINTPNDCVYYSLQVPTYLESIPKYRVPSSARIDLVELIDLMDYFIRELMNDSFMNDSINHIRNILNSVQFDYFHSESDKNMGIYPTSDMPIDDERLLYMPEGYEKRKFCERSSFVRGCIRISKKIF